MKVNLNKSPFSMRGSYMAISELAKDYRLPDAGLYLRTVRGSAERSMVAKLTPLFNGKEEEYIITQEMTALIIQYGDQKIEVCFDDPETMLFRGTAGTGMIIDFMTEKYKNDYIYDIQHRAYTLYMANCYKNNCRYLIWALRDKISLEQKWQGQIAQYSRLRVESPDGFMFAIREVVSEWSGKLQKYEFSTSRHKTQLDYLEFFNNIGSYPLEFQDHVAHAVYLEWSSIVAESGFLTRNPVLLSKSWLSDKAGGNLNFVALDFSRRNPKMAWEQYMAQFDMMDESGRIPEGFNDSTIRWNHIKPPVQGWILSKMMKNMELSREQIIEAYVALEKWTDWWIRYRDFRHEGLFIYDHSRDSIWENSTVFSKFPPIASPELQAFLIIQMEVIAELAGMLGIEDEKEKWMKLADKYLKKMLDRCIVNNLPVAIHSNTGDIIESDSLLPYEFMILGDRLPKEVRDACIEVFSGDKFRTGIGIATESPASPAYKPDTKYCGPIWASSTMFIIDGLQAIGAEDIAQEELKKYMDLILDQGIAESYDAMTGETLEPTLYTVTAGAFMYLLDLYTKSLENN